MKAKGRLRKKSRFDLEDESFSLSNAKTYLGRLVEKARRGEPVYIVRGQHRFMLQEVPLIDPIPMRPAGYFADVYSKAEIQEQNILAKASVVRAPRDIE